MKGLKFTKMSGNGNDFIVIDNYNGSVRLTKPQIEALCKTRFSIGADGLILLEKYRKPYDFYMRFYNNDGKEAEMCGNGGRCISRFAFLNKRAKARMLFMAKDGQHEAVIKSGGIVKLKMVNPYDVRQEVRVRVRGKSITGTFMNTGVPHFVVPVKDIDKVDVQGLGRILRFHSAFGPKGTNVNFVQKIGGKAGVRRKASGDKRTSFAIRTYERGVEAETYACGTGATAAGIALYMNKKAEPPVKLLAKGGLLTIYFKETEHCGFADVWLEGNARVVCEGVVSSEAFKF